MGRGKKSVIHVAQHAATGGTRVGHPGVVHSAIVYPLAINTQFACHAISLHLVEGF